MNDQHIYTHDADKGDDSGVAAIVKAFMRNPAGALQILAFIGGMFGVYYAIQGEIVDVRAAQVSNYEKINAKLDGLSIASTDERTKLEAVYTRGDSRYSALVAKLSAHDVDIARIVAALDFIVDQYKQSGVTPRPIKPSITPTPLVP